MGSKYGQPAIMLDLVQPVWMLTHKLCRMAYPRLNSSLILRARAEAASLQEAALVIMHDW